jgi:hypothetical protein
LHLIRTSALVCLWSRSFTRAQSCTPTQRTDTFTIVELQRVDRIGELRISVARSPHCKLVLSTVLGRCVVVHGWRLCSPSR